MPRTNKASENALCCMLNIALSDCAEAFDDVLTRGCPVAAVLCADAAIQVKVDLIRGPFARKVRHVEYALLRLRSGNGIVQTPAN